MAQEKEMSFEEFAARIEQINKMATVVPSESLIWYLCHLISEYLTDERDPQMPSTDLIYKRLYIDLEPPSGANTTEKLPGEASMVVESSVAQAIKSKLLEGEE